MLLSFLDKSTSSYYYDFGVGPSTTQQRWCSLANISLHNPSWVFWISRFTINKYLYYTWAIVILLRKKIVIIIIIKIYFKKFWHRLEWITFKCSPPIKPKYQNPPDFNFCCARIFWASSPVWKIDTYGHNGDGWRWLLPCSCWPPAAHYFNSILEWIWKLNLMVCEEWWFQNFKTSKLPNAILLLAGPGSYLQPENSQVYTFKEDH